MADLAAAARTFVPLAPPGVLAEAGFDPLPDLAVWLRTFLDGYGLTDRKAILPAVRRCALDEHELTAGSSASCQTSPANCDHGAGKMA